jgi:hypothetical protein
MEPTYPMQAINSRGLMMIMVGMTHELRKEIDRLVEGMNKLEQDITIATEMMKEYYTKASISMPTDKSYFLNGVQTGSVIKSYLLTRRGIEVPGEGTINVPEFIDSVLRFANYPKRKIDVLSDLSAHLESIDLMIRNTGA